MSRSARLFVSSFVCALALAFGGNALAAYNPALTVTAPAGASHALGADDPVVIGVAQAFDDDATAAIVIYSPLRYGVTLGQSVGTQLGVVAATVKLPVGGTFVRAPFQGTVRVDNPANYLNNPCTRNPAPHQAVWLLDGTLAGQSIRIPLYVDRITSGPEAAFASARIRLCLPSPYIPPSAGGAMSGASLISAGFSVSGVFSNPTVRGNYPWQGVFVPYTVGTGVPNQGNAAQSISITRLPVRLAVTAKKVRRGKRRFARVTACLSEAGQGIRGVTLNVHAGRTARRTKRVARVRTNARGCGTVLVRLRFRVTFIRATGRGASDDFDVPFRNVTSQGCGTPMLAPRCTTVLVAGVFRIPSRTLRVRR